MGKVIGHQALWHTAVLTVIWGRIFTSFSSRSVSCELEATEELGSSLVEIPQRTNPLLGSSAVKLEIWLLCSTTISPV